MPHSERDTAKPEKQSSKQVERTIGDVAIDLHGAEVPRHFAVERPAPESENTRTLSQVEDHITRLSRRGQLAIEERGLINCVAGITTQSMIRLYEGGMGLHGSAKFNDAAHLYSRAAGKLLHGKELSGDAPLDYDLFGKDVDATVSILQKVSEVDPVISDDDSNRSIIEDLAISGAAMLAPSLQTRDALVAQDGVLSHGFSRMHESYQAALAAQQTEAYA